MGVNLEEKSFGFYLQQSDERCIFALHKICNIKHVMTVKRYASEDRFFWNMVFARSKEELNRKLIELKSFSPQTNYNKFSETLAPMIYWGGDSVYDVIATEDIE